MTAQSDTNRPSRNRGWGWTRQGRSHRAAAAAVAGALLVLAGCGGEDPADPFKRLTAAIADGNTGTTCALLSDQYLAAEDGCENAARFTADEREHAARIVDLRTLDAFGTDERAVVEGLFEGSERQEAEIVFVKEGGEWKACRIDVGFSHHPEEPSCPW